MTDAGFLRALRSVGMAAFVTHLPLFEGSEDTATAAERLHLATGWQPVACRTRVTYARAILGAGRRREALEAIAAAGRVDEDVRAMARRLLRN